MKHISREAEGWLPEALELCTGASKSLQVKVPAPVDLDACLCSSGHRCCVIVHYLAMFRSSSELAVHVEAFVSHI